MKFTPEGTLGPFYPGAFALEEMPKDLTTIAPVLAHKPQGQPIRVTGRCIDSNGAPVPSLIIEVWQANAHGRYRHPEDRSSRPLDPQFDGFARVRTGDDGRFTFSTIKPGAHDSRAPHLRLTIFASGIDRLETQIFFDDEAGNESDPVLCSIPDPSIRRRLIARRTRSNEYAIDFMLRGGEETPFFGAELLAVVLNDRESEARTPSQPLYMLPRSAQDAFAAMPVVPNVAAAEADLTRIGVGRPQAAGEAIEITGRVVDEDARPVRRTLIEIWNANAHGRYSHALDAERTTAPLDPNFYGFGRLVSDDDGVYRLRTIKPGAYIARPDIGWWRPPHVHFSIVGGGVRLVTQMYFPNDPLNEKDYIHMIIPADARRLVIGAATAPHQFRFDITVRGRYQTPFEY